MEKHVMDLSIGLPNTIPSTRGDQLLEFARVSEAAGFSSLGTLDRLVYGGLEPLTALAAAAGVTERIGLETAVLLAPYRLNAVLLAKEAATVQRISGGRLTLGLGLGWREDDYEASGTPYNRRGRKLDEMLPELERVWSGAEYGFAGGVGPDVSDSPPKLMIGGAADVAFERAARYGIGWILGGGTPDQAREGREKAEAAWRDAGREGRPRVAALNYFSLGPEAERNAEEYLGHYYAAMGEEVAKQIVAGAAKDPEDIRQRIDAFAQAGCDELFFFPCSPDPQQANLLAEAGL
jgi:alkanesulfonate monooxygenase SsuD/methylene tetrahydromethanopterin reductase-like flavin-dependent oxidoreductase (luciferase family)